VTDERRQRILQVAAELEAQGLPASNSRVYAICMGHRGHIVQTLKARRAALAAAGGMTAVDIPDEDDEPEDEEAETPARVLAEDLRQLEAAYEGFHVALEKLWDLEREGVWDENISSRQTYLEKTLTKNLQQQERLRLQLDAALIREAVYAAQAQHDTRVAEVQAKAEAFLQAVAHVAQLGEDLADTFQQQIDAFEVFRDRHGRQAFDVQSGFDTARQLFEAFYPSDFRARDTFYLLVSRPPTIGQLRAALAACPRLQPFSERAIASYLNQHQPEGTAHGQHP
jgi:hypothetical protein